jgi:tetratricopeptide (TPR) repeat protein
MNATAKKQPKDVNSVTQTRFLMIAVRLAPICALLGWVIGGLQGVLYGLTVSVLAVFAVELLSGGIGDGSVNILYGTGRLDRTMQDQFIGTLSQARFHKMGLRHDLALECVNEVLAAAPNYIEALFLKAQILWEGYHDAANAKNCLIHVIKVEPDKEAPFHRWSLALYKEMAHYERDQNELILNKKRIKLEK